MVCFVLLLILIRNDRNGNFRMNDRSVVFGGGGFSGIRWGMIFWDIRPKMDLICGGYVMVDFGMYKPKMDL